MALNFSAERWRLVNVILLGLGFMMLFTAFQTTSMCAKLVTTSLKTEGKNTSEFLEEFDQMLQDQDFVDNYEKDRKEILNNYNGELTDENEIVEEKMKDDLMNQKYGDGFVSMSILYAVFSLANFASAAIVKIIGHKMTMFISALTYLNYICMYLFPNPAYMYVSSIIIGIGAACIWTAQGAFLHLNSPTEKLMSRNTGIFWCMLQMNLIFGNLYIYFAWQGKKYIDSSMRTTLFTGFGILAAAGTFVFLLLNGNVKDDSDQEENKQEAEKMLLLTREMLLLIGIFMYSGFVLSFFSGVYPTSIGNSNLLENSMSVVGLVGLSVGFGEVLGGGLFVFGSKFMSKIKTPILLSSCIVIHLVAFCFVLVNLPLDANMNPTDLAPCIVTCIVEKPSAKIAVFTAFLLGIGDAGVNNVIYTTISKIWKKESAPAFALMKCLQSLAAAISFFIAAKINVLWNVGLLVFFAVLTIATYFPLMSKFDKFEKTEGEK